MPEPPAAGPVAQALVTILGTTLLVGLPTALVIHIVRLASWESIGVALLWALTLFVCSRIVAHPKATEESPRANATICHFARAFERRTVDTWILRATYEILSEGGKPIRADDHLSDLRDADDLDFEVLDVADRCGRSLDQPEANPFYGSITTVRDLVLFLNHQPMLAATRAFRGMHG
jgi:hypothetical protein